MHRQLQVPVLAAYSQLTNFIALVFPPKLLILSILYVFFTSLPFFLEKEEDILQAEQLLYSLL